MDATSGIAEEKLVYLHGSASCFGSALYCDEPEFAQSDQHRVGFREAFAMAQVPNRLRSGGDCRVFGANFIGLNQEF